MSSLASRGQPDVTRETTYALIAGILRFINLAALNSGLNFL